MNWVCIIKMTSESFGLLAAKDDVWSIRGFTSEREGLDFFESSYARFHAMGREGSASVTLNWLSFQPSICQLDIATIEAMVEERIVRHVRNISGRVDVIPLLSVASLAWETGSKPRLI